METPPAVEQKTTRKHRPKRTQVSRACARCRRLQKGCSERRPCDRCTKVGLGDQCIARQTSEETVQSHTPQSPLVGLALAPSTPFAATGTVPIAANHGFIPSYVVNYCVERYFSHLFGTIPILTASYMSSITSRCLEQRDSAWREASCLVSALCALVMLQVEEADGYSFPGMVRETNGIYGRSLLDRALLERHQLPLRPRPSMELIILTFLIYACHARLCRHSQAFFFLRESATLLLLHDPEPNPVGTEDISSVVYQRLFWVLLISERSNAIRYRRPVTLQVTKAVSGLDEALVDHPHLVGFRCLALLFQPLDTAFFALLNEESRRRTPSVQELGSIESAINSALEPASDHSLHDTQKSNLRVTQLWLRIILWQMRLRLGFLSEKRDPISLSYSYPLELAKDLMLSTRDLSLEAMRVHGIGLTEKLFDMACTVVDVLARVPLSVTQPVIELGFEPVNNLRYLRHLITELPGGASVYTELLDKHVEEFLPNMDL